MSRSACFSALTATYWTAWDSRRTKAAISSGSYGRTSGEAQHNRTQPTISPRRATDTLGVFLCPLTPSQDAIKRTGHRWTRQHATGQQWAAGAQERHCKREEANKPSRRQAWGKSGGSKGVETEEGEKEGVRAERGNYKRNLLILLD